MRLLLAILLLALLLLAACQPVMPLAGSASPAAAAPASAPQQEVAAALQGLLDDQVRTQNILGMAMAVRLADGSTVFRESGDLDRAGERSWSLETQSALGSVTKTFTAVVIMQLVEEGKLALDDTIEGWFPDQPYADHITVRMLLSHTSGLANPMRPGNERDPMWAQEWAPLELVAEANRNGPVDTPGSSIAHYSNTGYYLLGLIVEAVTGNTWEHEVRTRIIEPLKLEHTTFLGEEGVWGGTLVEGYSRTPDGYISTLEIADLPHASTAWAAGGVASTLADLMTFASAFFDGKLVSEASMVEMTTPVAPDDSSPRLWGLGGATLAGLPPGGFGMGGDVPGYHAFFVGVPEPKYVVVAFINTEEGDVVGPGLMALDYLLSLPRAGQGTTAP